MHLIQNSGFETDDADWAPGFRQYSHSSQVYYTGPAPAGAAEYYGWAWGAADGTTMGTSSQVIDLTGTVSPGIIDGGGAAFDFSAWLSSYTGDTDYALVGVAWNDALAGTGNAVGAGVTFDGNDAYVDLVSLDVIPEPATALLLGLSGIALALRARGRKAR